MLNTPILLITFNRPDHVRTALLAIRNQQPTDLYIAQDGPRVGREDDIIQCQKVKDIVNDFIDWPCNLHTHYQKSNLGCGRGPYEAMSWFFENVEYGIILEDDINPHPLFFKFMEELLVKYKDDNRIGMVCGHNLQRRYCGKYSYYFTYKMAGTLGWGTWQRVWKDFDFDILYKKDIFEENIKQYYGFTKLMAQQTSNRYKKWLSTDRNDCWDYQFDYYLLVNGYLNIRPNSCLTSHEGDDADATHSGYVNPNYKMEINELLFNNITHPKVVRIALKERMRIYVRTIKLLIKKMLSNDSIVN